MKIHTNKRLIAAAAVMAFTLTGCGSVPDLDHVNRDMEAEYMAGALLKYDKNNDDMLDYDRSILRQRRHRHRLRQANRYRRRQHRPVLL